MRNKNVKLNKEQLKLNLDLSARLYVKRKLDRDRRAQKSQVLSKILRRGKSEFKGKKEPKEDPRNSKMLNHYVNNFPRKRTLDVRKHLDNMQRGSILRTKSKLSTVSQFKRNESVISVGQNNLINYKRDNSFNLTSNSNEPRSAPMSDPESDWEANSDIPEGSLSSEIEYVFNEIGLTQAVKPGLRKPEEPARPESSDVSITSISEVSSATKTAWQQAEEKNNASELDSDEP